MMGILFGSIIVVILCFTLLVIFNKRDTTQAKAIYKRSNILYCASNKNSYTKARDVFKTLREAGIEINFLGGSNE